MNLKDIYSKRNPWTHKGEHGYVLVVSGSKRYSGSPVFNIVSALRGGADLVCCAGPERAMNIAASFLPDIITHPLKGDFLRIKDVPFILRAAERFDSLIIGCGLGKSPETLKAIQEIIEEQSSSGKPLVIDADAITALAGKKEVLKGNSVVITPHIKEFEVLTGEKVKPEAEDREEKVKKWAKKLNCTILLKGHVDIISDGGRVALNETGSPHMTKGGFGDTLSGILGALLARKIKPFDAAKAASFINGKAGEMACEKYGEGVLASDIFEFIPQVIKEF